MSEETKQNMSKRVSDDVYRSVAVFKIVVVMLLLALHLHLMLSERANYIQLDLSTIDKLPIFEDSFKQQQQQRLLRQPQQVSNGTVNKNLNNFTTDQVSSGTAKKNLNNLTTDHVVRDYNYFQQKSDRQLPSNKLFMVGPWEPKSIIESNIALSPKLEIHFFNDSSMTRMAHEIDQQLKDQVGLHGAFESYKALRPWAYRADLFRYMILWSQGGIYLDSKIVLTSPIETWAALKSNETLAVCNDRPKFQSKTLGKPVQALWNAAMSARKGSPVLLESIRLVVNTVMERKYALKGEHAQMVRSGHPWLGVTGPYVLGYASFSSPGFSQQVSTPCSLKNDENVYQGSDIIMKQDQIVHKSMQAKGHYADLYNRGNLYCSNKTMSYDCNITEILGS